MPIIVLAGASVFAVLGTLRFLAGCALVEQRALMFGTLARRAKDINVLVPDEIVDAVATTIRLIGARCVHVSVLPTPGTRLLTPSAAVELVEGVFGTVLRLRLPSDRRTIQFDVVVRRWRAPFMTEALDMLGAHAAVALRNAHTHDTVATLSAEIAYSAAHDPLTGLANRSQVDAMLDAVAADAASAAVLYVDLDDFKPVNDRLGHEAGDAVLVEVARRIGDAAGPCATVGRLGGDEFMVVLRGEDVRLRGAATRRRIDAALAAPVAAGGRAIQVHASIGLAVAHGSTWSPEEVRRAADADMYRRKLRRRRPVLVSVNANR